jgi:hypothetical protein
MRESRTYGFVRGARGNSRPYRVARFAALHESGCGIVSRVTPVHTALRNCTRDEGRVKLRQRLARLQPRRAAKRFCGFARQSPTHSTIIMRSRRLAH